MTIIGLWPRTFANCTPCGSVPSTRGRVNIGRWISAREAFSLRTPASAGLQPHAGARVAHLHWWNPCRNGAGLWAPGGCVRKNYRALEAARCCQKAVKLSWVAGAFALAVAANGARMPSTADDVLAEIRSSALRAATVRLRRYGLDSLRVMGQWFVVLSGFTASADVGSSLSWNQRKQRNILSLYTLY